MARTAQTKPDASAGADETPPSYPGLKTAVIVMGILLVAGFIVVFATIINRATDPGTDRAGGEAAGTSGFEAVESLIPSDAAIGTMTLDGDRLAVQVVGENGMEIILFDVRQGRELGRIRLSPQ